jgi:uroporphyrinogen-III synthase
MVLLTRPLSQAGNLQSLLEDSDLNYVLFPAIEINKISAETPKQLYDVVVFVSVNAVIYAREYFNSAIKESTKIFAVGSATAKSLSDNGLIVDAFPENEASSESLLAMPEFSLTDKKILIVRGRGGSEVLKNELIKNNIVDYLEVYERTPCDVSSLHIESLERFMSNSAGIVMANSIESLRNIYQLISNIRQYHLEEILQRPIVVLSNRIKEYAKTLGFTNINVVKSQSDEGVLRVLLNILGRTVK